MAIGDLIFSLMGQPDPRQQLAAALSGGNSVTSGSPAATAAAFAPPNGTPAPNVGTNAAPVPPGPNSAGPQPPLHRVLRLIRTPSDLRPNVHGFGDPAVGE